MSIVQTSQPELLDARPAPSRAPGAQNRAAGMTSAAMGSSARRHAVAVDIGSTYTKACLVELGDGRLIATAAHPTTPEDLRKGLGHTLERLHHADAVADALTIACS